MKITLHFLALAFSKGINIPLILLEATLIGKILGIAQFGQWSLLFAAATLLHNICINWTHAITIRIGCEEWTQNQTLNQTFSTRFTILSFGFLFIFLLLILQPFDWLSRFYLLPANFAWFVFLNLLSIWLTLECQSLLQAKNKIARQAWLTPCATFSSVCFLVYLFIKPIQPIFFVLVIGINCIKIGIWGGALLLELKNTRLQWQTPKSRNIQSALMFSWPLIPTIILGYLSDWGDHLLLGSFCTLREVGIWGLSYQILLGAISLNSILITILLPWIIRRNQLIPNTPHFYLTQIIPGLISFWLIGIIILITFLPALVNLIVGKHYHDEQNIFLFLNIAVLTNIFSSLYGILFNLQNRLKIILFYNFIMVMINFSVSLLLIPTKHLEGAAIATVLSYAIVHFLYVFDQHLFLRESLTKISYFFIFILLIGITQYKIGPDIGMRILFCAFALLTLIWLIRKTQSIQSVYLNQYFTGILNPVGFLLGKVLISSHDHQRN